MLFFVKFYLYDTKLYYLKSRICQPPPGKMSGKSLTNSP